MALDRNQAGLLFKIDVDTMDGAQQIELFKGVVSGASAEIREQFQRMGSSVQQSFSGATRSITSFDEKLGETSTNQLRGFLGQFGMVGDAAGDMIPALSGSSAAMLGLAGASVAAGAALAATAVKAMDYTGKVNDLAQVTNLTTETIQSLQLAATLSGQSFEEVSQTAVIFQKKIEEAKSGNEELMATFKALGVDLNGPVDAAFRQTLEKLNGLEDGSLKTAVSLDLFGKSGSKLLPVMDQVGGSFDGLITRAQELGIVLSEEDIAKSNEFADKLDILSLKMKGLTNDVGVGLINFLNDLGDAFAQAFDPAAADQMQAKLEEMQNKTRQEGTVNADLRARLEGVDTGANAPNAMQIALEEARRKVTPAKTGGKTAATEKLVSLPSGDAITRAYEQYRQMIANEEKATAAQREKLRVEAIDGEEARLRDRLIQQDESIARARAEASAGARTGRADVLNAIVANLEAEKALTQQAISEMEAARVRAMIRFTEAARANTEKRIADEIAAEEKRLDDEAMAYELYLERIDDLKAAADARRQAALEADPSSPLNIFGKAGQDAADKGAGIFGQLGASAKGALSEVTGEIPKVAEMMNGMFSGIANGLQNMIQGFILTGKLGGAAFKAMAAQIVSALASEAAVKAIFNLAEGFAALATGLPTKAASHFTAAKIYGVVAGVAAAAAVSMAAIGPGGGSGGGQFLSESRGGGGSTMREQGSRRNEPQVIIIRAETEPGVMVSKFVQDYRQNGEARGVLRRDLLGEY